MSAQHIVDNISTISFNGNADHYIDNEGNYIFLRDKKVGKNWIKVPGDVIPKETCEKWISIMADEDHKVELQERYDNENTDYTFGRKKLKEEDGIGNPIENIPDPKGDVLDAILNEEKEDSPLVKMLLECMELLTEDQRNLIYDHYGSCLLLKEICDMENKKNGTDKSPQSVGNRKNKIIARLKKLMENP